MDMLEKAVVKSTDKLIKHNVTVLAILFFASLRCRMG